MLLYLPKSLAPLAKLAAKESARYSMTGVRVLDKGNGTYRVEAIDGRMAAIVRGYSHIPGPGGVPNEDMPEDVTEVIVPLKLWQEAMKLGGKKTEIVGVAAGGNAVMLGNEAGNVTGEPVEGRFPDLNSVLPKGPPQFALRVHALRLIALLQAAAAISGAAGEAPVATLLYYPNSPILGIVAVGGPEGPFFDGLLMTLTGE